MYLNAKVGRDLNSLSTNLKSLVENINSSVSKINNSQSLSSYNSEKSNYDNLINQYNNLNSQYQDTLEKYDNISDFKNAKVITYDIPNAKDENLWKAGNVFYNAKFAGGGLFSSTAIPDVDGKASSDEGYIFNNGKQFAYLNEGLTEVQSVAKGGEHFDLMGTDKETEVMLEASMTITKSNGEVFTFNKFIHEFGDSEGGNSGYSNTSSIQSSVNSMSAMLNAKGINLMNTGWKGAIINWGITNVLDGSVFKSKDMTLKNFIGSSVIGSFKSLLSNKLAGVVSSALNLTATGFTGFALIGVLSYAISELVSEVIEIAADTDIHFGLGGEYISHSSLTRPQYEKIGTLKGLFSNSGFDQYDYTLNSDGSIGNIYGDEGRLESSLNENGIYVDANGIFDPTNLTHTNPYETGQFSTIDSYFERNLGLDNITDNWDDLEGDNDYDKSREFDRQNGTDWM